MKTILTNLLLLTALCTGCDKSSEPRFGRTDTIRSIASLKALCSGQSAVVRQDFFIRGRVTGNDQYGEFYKTLVIEDSSGGISIAADNSALWADYPFGSEVTVSCNGLTLYDYGGKIRLGAAPAGNGVQRIALHDLPRYLRVGPPDGTQIRPVRLTIPEIGIRHADRYVRLDGVRFLDTGDWCGSDPETPLMTTEHPVADAAGNTLSVRTFSTCIYANEHIPSGTGTLCGIIDYFNGKLSLCVTNYQAEFSTAEAPATTCPSTAGYSTPKPRR